MIYIYNNLLLINYKNKINLKKIYHNKHIFLYLSFLFFNNIILFIYREHHFFKILVGNLKKKYNFYFFTYLKKNIFKIYYFFLSNIEFNQ